MRRGQSLRRPGRLWSRAMLFRSVTGPTREEIVRVGDGPYDQGMFLQWH